MSKWKHRRQLGGAQLAPLKLFIQRGLCKKPYSYTLILCQDKWGYGQCPPPLSLCVIYISLGWMVFSGCPHASRTDQDPHITVWVWKDQGHAHHTRYTCHINLDATGTNAVGVTIWDRQRGPVPFVTREGRARHRPVEMTRRRRQNRRSGGVSGHRPTVRSGVDGVSLPSCHVLWRDRGVCAVSDGE